MTGGACLFMRARAICKMRARRDVRSSVVLYSDEPSVSTVPLLMGVSVRWLLRRTSWARAMVGELSRVGRGGTREDSLWGVYEGS